MDYRDYRALMERYHELAAVSVAPEETRESLIMKLVENSYAKKQIWLQTNAIIQEYIVKYEKTPALLDAEAVVLLRDFLSLLMPSDGSGDYVDPSISLRICRLLLRYYQKARDLNQTVQILCLCAMFDILLLGHRADSASSPYTLMAERYLESFDELTEQNKRRLVNCWLLCVYDQKHQTFGLKKYRDIRRRFAEIRQKMGDGFELENYIQCEFYALGYAMNAWYNPNREASPEELLKDLDENRDLIEELSNDLRAVAASEQAKELLLDRMITRYYIAQADYYLGKITAEEMLARTEELTHPQEDGSLMEYCTTLFVMNTCYLDNLRRLSGLDKQAVREKTLEIIAHVRQNMTDALKGLDERGQYLSVSEGHHYMLELMSVTSGIVDFDYFKRIVLDMTVYANKELFVHTMMVKEICLVLLDCLLDQAPEYLDGVAGQPWTHWRDHRSEAMTLMENSALFHDVGKFFCLDFVTNSSRSLTEDEFEFIKDHPVGFSAIYRGEMTPEMACVRDCAHLHHRWYDETGGYPQQKHTRNKPFVNILTIADCIDAATDDIGRPYGLGKTLEQVMAEFDAGKDTRYSGYICELLHREDIQRKIGHVMKERRRDLYCDIYFSDHGAM